MIEQRLPALVALGFGALLAVTLIGLGTCIILAGRNVAASLDRLGV
jgi:hypothetical protein